ncbi:hypothetical protein [Nocardia sp. NPDC050793]|uniref:hypothetical protein n=1 Tax=Nocardia sp. NPDC050793 TaxID=3155159 RepID=UPI0033EE06E9
MNIRTSITVFATALAVTGFAWASTSSPAHAAQVWGACGKSSEQNKVVATYSKATLKCGTDGWGFRHIQGRHLQDWQNLADIEGKNWRDIADLAIAKSLDAPDRTGPAGGGKTCYSGQIYLVNRVTGQIAKTVDPTVIVGSDGAIITAYPGGKACRG